jgi:hypothetical protein
LPCAFQIRVPKILVLGQFGKDEPKWQRVVSECVVIQAQNREFAIVGEEGHFGVYLISQGEQRN